MNISVQAANLSYCRIESNRKNRFGSENRIESNRNFFLPKLECSTVDRPSEPSAATNRRLIRAQPPPERFPGRSDTNLRGHLLPGTPACPVFHLVVRVTSIGWEEVCISHTYSSRVVSVLDSGAEGPGFKSQSRRNSLRQTAHTHRASVHQLAAKLVAALLRVAEITAGLAESNGSLPPGL